MNGNKYLLLGMLAAIVWPAAGTPLLNLDFTSPGYVWPTLPAGVSRAELPEGGACLQLNAGVAQYAAATAAVAPGTKYRLTIRARVAGSFTVEQNARAQVESLQRWGNLESAYTIRFHDPETNVQVSGGGGFLLTSEWYDYTHVFRTPADVRQVTVRFEPRNNLTQVALISLVADNEGGVLNNNPDFRYGELNYCGWRPQRDGRIPP